MARRIVVVGASAGGVEALVAIARALPGDLAAPVAVVLHTPATGTSALPAILARSGPLDARHAHHGEALEDGTIYRVGHAYGAESLVGAQSDTIEAALWTALRALEERIDLQRRVSRRLRERGDGRRAENYERQALESEPHVNVLREVLLERGSPEG